MTTTPVLLAAGPRTRFGRCTQLAPVGPHGAVLLEYALCDAVRAGCARAVLVASPETESALAARVAARWRSRLDVTVVVQPEPRGTLDAALTAAPRTAGACAVINADDFYGREPIARIVTGPDESLLVAWPLAATVPAAGAVSRAVCRLADGVWLNDLVEYPRIVRRDGRCLSGGVAVDGEAPVSLNCWRFAAGVLPRLAPARERRRDLAPAPDRAEAFLPDAVAWLIGRGELRVRVVRAAGDWFGLTNPGDRALVETRLRDLHDRGVYPEDLRA